MIRFISLKRSDKPEKKYMVTIEEEGREKTIHFGQSGAKDFTLSTPFEREARKQAYISRHKSREDWTSSGRDTAGFYAKHILWNKPTISASLADMKRRFFS